MRLKFVDADDPNEAAFLAALSLGPSALLVDGGGDGERRFASVSGENAERPAPSAAELVEAVLFHHDASAALTQRVLNRRQKRVDPERLLTTGLRAAIKFAALPRASRTRLMLIGPPAAGKTTMIGKLAARGAAPTATVLSTDCERPGGLEQLLDFTKVLGIEPERLALNDDLAVAMAAERGPLLIDTAGTEPGAGGGFTELGALAQRLAVEPVLVLPALMDADEARGFARAARAIGATKLLVTRLDMARRMAALLAAADEGLAIAGASVTPHFAFGLKTLNDQTLAHHMMRLAQRKPHGEQGDSGPLG